MDIEGETEVLIEVRSFFQTFSTLRSQNEIDRFKS